MKVIQYSRNLDIRNLAILPHGTGCKFLIVIDGLDEVLIAKQWTRKTPSKLETGESIVKF